MQARRATRLGTAALWLVAGGCTALREVPRDQYAVRPERRDISVVTRDSLKYQFDVARFQADTLTGFRRREVEGPIDEYHVGVRLALDDVSRISARRVDWYRTGLVGGVALAAILAAALSRSNNDPVEPPPGDCGPRPCP
jgi:hypothetical protein